MTTTDPAAMTMTYTNLRAFLDAGHTVIVPGLISIHDHPDSGRPREIHFEVDGVKIAEIGPVERVDTEDVREGYVSIVEEWMGQPTEHQAWKDRILADNGMRVQTDLRSLARRVLLATSPQTLYGTARPLADAVLANGDAHETHADALAAPRATGRV